MTARVLPRDVASVASDASGIGRGGLSRRFVWKVFGSIGCLSVLMCGWAGGAAPAAPATLVHSNALPLSRPPSGPLEKPEEPRIWSEELHQFLMRSPTGGMRRLGLPESARSSSVGNEGFSVASTNAGATFQEPSHQIDEERMDQLIRRIDEGGLGIEPRAGSRTAVGRAIDAVFIPEPIRLGRAELGFSPYTAIKRKNPFCLLNPIPLTLSW